MLRTALVLDSRYRAHENPSGHPERAERIEALLPLAEDPGREDIVRIEPREATRSEILAVHTEEHFERIAATAKVPLTTLDADTSACARSFEIARLAAGGVLATLDAIMTGRAENAFALVRPPGHHAERSRAMGFCLFNNVAIGAEYLRRRYHLPKIFILDWDVHHGNGTQEIFYEEANVLYASLHQFPLYPGTGSREETGAGSGRGATVNVPLRAGCRNEQFLAAYRSVIEPRAREFGPDFVLISAGFDAHHRDPLAQMYVSEEGFVELTRDLLHLARDTCEGRLAAVLEGGYDLRALQDSVGAVLGELRGEHLLRETPS